MVAHKEGPNASFNVLLVQVYLYRSAIPAHQHSNKKMAAEKAILRQKS